MLDTSDNEYISYLKMKKLVDHQKFTQGHEDAKLKIENIEK